MKLIGRTCGKINKKKTKNEEIEKEKKVKCVSMSALNAYKEDLVTSIFA